MNAEAMAENRPACCPCQHASTQEFRCETYEDEGRIQIPIVFIHELLIVLSSFLAVTLIEFAPGILLSRW